MTPDEKAKIRLDFQAYVIGTATEWLRAMVIEHGRLEGVEVSVTWRDVTDGAAIAELYKVNDVEPFMRFGVQVDTELLPELPPIGPEKIEEQCVETRIFGPILEQEFDHRARTWDGITACLACKGKGCEICHEVGQWREPQEPISLKPRGPENDPAMIEEIRPSVEFDPDYPGCAPETCGGSRLDPCLSILRTKGEYHDSDQPEWVPATFLMCLAGDRIRIGPEETDVRRSSSGVWNANTSNPWHPTPWRHTELRMDLAANPGFQQYPPQTPCEILMTPERKAVHLLMQTFPGSQIVSSDIN